MASGSYVVAFLGLGSNEGERLEHLRAGARALARGGTRLRRASSVYEGPYVGAGNRQRPYLNAAVEVETQRSPLALLRWIQDVERGRGRQPGSHLQPRPLDIDVLFYGDVCVRHPRLVVPHPGLGERRFVLEPLAELGALSTASRRSLGARLDALRTTQPLVRVATLDVEGSRDPVVT
jgi:2-amino-4-hydroxy-6-hydroxymethyldihydropteridine diphosphokinase